MQLQIISPENSSIYDIVWIEVSTSVGNFIIQDGYEPTILSLKDNGPVLFRLYDGDQKRVILLNATAEILRSKITILASSQS